MKKLITILLLVAIISVAGYGAWQWQNRQKADVFSDLQTAPAERGRLTATIGATGTVRSNQTAELYWGASGSVEAIYVQVGERVRAGDVLAKLAQTSLPQNVILAQADLVNAQKALDDLNTQAQDAKVAALQAIATQARAVKDAQFQLDNYTVPMELAGFEIMEALDAMEKKLDQARQAFEPYKYYSADNETRKELKEDLDQAQSDYNAAVKRLEYEYELQVAQANLEKARSDYEKWKNGPDPADISAIEARIAAAEAAISLAQLEAPFDGAITVANPKPGDQVASAAQGSLSLPAFRLDDLSKLLVDVQVSEVDINQVEIGQQALLSFDAILGVEYRGSVVEVSQVGSVVQGVVDFTVTIELNDADETVKPGMTAAVNIVVSQLEDVLLIPNRAVRIQDGERVVYVLRDNQLVAAAITLGASSDTVSEVVAGDLQAGDPIVLNPPVEFESNGPPPFVQR
ncbi:MAG: efflux RND transporter periplasmic adaptor subunit [Anaerolineales bacterium]|nr:efflux RND transporter periplasmic adaptor subunit [Anaerolineales bacterium]